MGVSVKGIIFIFSVVMIVSTYLKCQPLSMESIIPIGLSHNIVDNFTKATFKIQYSSEEHTVVTEDGYVLTIFRAVKARSCNFNKKHRPVLVMHGVLQNSHVFLDAGPSAGLAYLLSDACYDVWVGNQRGNNYGRKHLKLNPDRDSEFWQFSADEVGFYDLPATIDYVLKQTGADKINYIGFSQGGGAYFIMCSERPGYCMKTAVMIGLAPSVINRHTESPLLSFIVKFFNLFNGALDMIGVHEIFKKGGFSQVLLEYLCQISGTEWVERLCGTCGFVDSYRLGSLTLDTQRRIFRNYLVGTSVKTLARYGQLIEMETFNKFDYGERMNLQRYNSAQPPEYNLHAVSTPVVLIQGKNDKLVSIKDTKTLATILPNVLEMVEVSDPSWTHFDMLYNRDIKKMIYPKINEYLELFSNDYFE